MIEFTSVLGPLVDVKYDPVLKRKKKYKKILKIISLWCLIMANYLWGTNFPRKGQGKKIRKYTSIASTCGTRDSQSERKRIKIAEVPKVAKKELT